MNQKPSYTGKDDPNKWVNLIEGLSKEDAQFFSERARENPSLFWDLVASLKVNEEIPSMNGIEFVLRSLALSYQVRKCLPRNVYEGFVQGMLDYGRGKENGLIQSRRELSILVEALVGVYEPPVDEKTKKGERAEVIKRLNKPGVTLYLVDYIEASRNGEPLSNGPLDESNLFEFIENWEDDELGPSRYTNLIFSTEDIS